MLHQTYKNLTPKQQLDFMEQIIIHDNTAINNLIVYSENKKSYRDPKNNYAVGEIVKLEIDSLWGSEKDYYINNNLVINSHVNVIIYKMRVLEKSNIFIILKNKNGYEIKDTLNAYIKKIELF